MTRRRPVIGHLARVQRLAEAGLLPGGERHAVVDEVEGGHGCGWRLRPTECLGSSRHVITVDTNYNCMIWCSIVHNGRNQSHHSAPLC